MGLHQFYWQYKTILFSPVQASRGISGSLACASNHLGCSDVILAGITLSSTTRSPALRANAC